MQLYSSHFPDGSDGKVSAYHARGLGLIPGSGRSSGEGNGNPFQYSCLEKSHGQRSLVGYSAWGRKQSDTAERLHFTSHASNVMLKILQAQCSKFSNVGLKLNIQKTKIMAFGPITSCKWMGKQWNQWMTLFFWPPKSLQMMTAAMKFKDDCSLEEKL